MDHYSAKKIEQWIDKTNLDYENQRVSCICFVDEFDGFYPVSFLEKSYFVVVENIPKPDFSGIREVGLEDFIDMKIDGITYKNTYYVFPHAANNLRLHFHELVHVAQWEILGTANFIQRYIEEIEKHGYDDAPLEIMAYGLDTHFMNNGEKINVPVHVSKKYSKFINQHYCEAGPPKVKLKG